MASYRLRLGVGLVGLWGALGLQGCGKGTTADVDIGEGRFDVGELALGLVLPDGSAVNTVNYAITRDGQPVLSGSMSVGSDGRASVLLSGLEAGAGYAVELVAPRDGADSCRGEAPFVVTADATTVVDVVMQCTDAGGPEGNINLNGRFNICPKITSTSATPIIVAVGSSSNVSANATDRDGDALTYSWSATSGSFAASTSASTSYTCTTVGEQTLTVEAFDGPERGCRKTKTIQISCAAGVDGGVDGGLDAGQDGSVDAGADGAVDGGAVFSSRPAYLEPVAPGVQVRAILTVGDAVGTKPNGSPYRLAGIPDGLGSYDNGDGTFTLLANHELGNSSGIVRAHGSAGSFVSKWKIRKSDLGVISGEDMIQQVQRWTAGAYTLGTTAFGRFCSADLPAVGAFYDAASSLGTQARFFLNGEETGAEGRALAHGVDGTSWELPRLGKASWENQVASPHAQAKTIVVGLDDSGNGQVYVYVGNKTNAGSDVAKAGLTNGNLYSVSVPTVAADAATCSGLPAGCVGLRPEPAAGIAPSAFTLINHGNVESWSGVQLETADRVAGASAFDRPEDGHWDPENPRDFYFVTTADMARNSRLWRLRFTNIAQPELGGQIEMLLDGSEGHKMLDNMTVVRGHVLATEDVGSDVRVGKIWRYTIATDTLVEIAQHEPDYFAPAAPQFLTTNEEASGIIDASDILGVGWFLVDVQAHYNIGDAELVEGGQLLAIYDPGSL